MGHGNRNAVQLGAAAAEGATGANLVAGVARSLSSISLGGARGGSVMGRAAFQKRCGRVADAWVAFEDVPLTLKVFFARGFFKS